jgi:hypothetical protein
MQAKLRTEKEMAERCSCSQRHLINLRNRRLIPFIKLGHLVRYNEDAVMRALDKLTVREVA